MNDCKCAEIAHLTGDVCFFCQQRPYWLCCGSTDHAHPDRREPDCFDPTRAKWGTREQHMEEEQR